MLETFEEGRDSITVSLNRRECNRAYYKLEEICFEVESSIKNLKEYQYKVGSKSDDNKQSAKM